MSAENNDYSSTEGLYESIKDHHHAVIARSRERGVVFPEFDESRNRWHDPGVETYDANTSNKWGANWDQEGILRGELVAGLQEIRHTQESLPLSEEGMARYFSEMSGASTLIEGRLYHASREGANRYFDEEHQNNNNNNNNDKNKRPPTLRVCLENRDGVESGVAAKYVVSLLIPLDDGSPLAAGFSMSKKELHSFFSGLRQALTWFEENPHAAILVHCSQGQSRSGLFVLLFMVLLVQSGLHRFEGVDARASNGAILLACLKHLLNIRAIVSFADRWHPFLDFFCSPDHRILDLLPPKSASLKSHSATPDSPAPHPNFDEFADDVFPTAEKETSNQDIPNKEHG